MKFNIDGEIWEVYQNKDFFYVYKNGDHFCTLNGYEFETESDACLAILNEYRA